ncbi:ZapG family protein [Kangiella spongicola]|uniref:Z-ring associated protein G n=1 Tax=Kangiella spongicola TaxID=796379 RepID=A0A318D2F5_9GAMM|nr:DUF1043 family protein [Kangiella spongicola]PXF63330.1 DUF1043 domain-containing protein [Kangiella spongicola]
MSAVLSIILIVLAAVVAFFVGRWHGLSTGSKELTQELESKDKELNELKSGVNEHFDETARLFSNLTEEYKTLYQHLATGANKLSDKDFKLKLSAPVGAAGLSSDIGESSSAVDGANVLDSEEHLTTDKVAAEDPTTSHEEESFIRDTDDSTETTIKEENSHSDPEQEVAKDNSQSVVKETAQADLDIEVSPPKDWAEDDIDENYHPNEPHIAQSEFADLASEEPEAPTAPGYEPKESESDNKK